MRQVQFSDIAFKQLQKMTKKDLKRIKQKLERFCIQEDTLALARKLVNSDLWTYRWRIWDWRVIFDVDEQWKIIIVLIIGKRKDIYR